MTDNKYNGIGVGRQFFRVSLNNPLSQFLYYFKLQFINYKITTKQITNLWSVKVQVIDLNNNLIKQLNFVFSYSVFNSSTTEVFAI